MPHRVEYSSSYSYMERRPAEAGLVGGPHPPTRARVKEYFRVEEATQGAQRGEGKGEDGEGRLLGSEGAGPGSRERSGGEEPMSE
eukprot:scaffold66049_cov28-Tisochrysis_lutea.AAC.1